MWKAPEEAWIEFLKIGLGYLLVILLGTLAVCIALGKVEEKTSHGLGPLLGCFQTLVGAFAGWSFGQNVVKKQKKQIKSMKKRLKEKLKKENELAAQEKVEVESEQEVA